MGVFFLLHIYIMYLILTYEIIVLVLKTKTSGTMEGGEGVIGTPSDGIVQKYTLGSSPRVEPMPQEKQTLMSTSLTQEDGVTVMEFTKYLSEEGEHTINPTGENVFLYAVGMSNDLGYHGSRGSFIAPRIQILTDTETVSPTRYPTVSCLSKCTITILKMKI